MTESAGVNRARHIALLCTGALLALLAWLRFAVAPLDTVPANLLVFILQTTPLIAVAVSLLLVTLRCAFWTAFVSLLYVCHGVVLTFTEADRLLGLVELILALALFGAGFALSFRLRSLRERSNGPE